MHARLLNLTFRYTLSEIVYEQGNVHKVHCCVFINKLASLQKSRVSLEYMIDCKHTDHFTCSHIVNIYSFYMDLQSNLKQCTHLTTFCLRPLSGDVCIHLVYIRKWSTSDVCTQHLIKA